MSSGHDAEQGPTAPKSNQRSTVPNGPSGESSNGDRNGSHTDSSSSAKGNANSLLRDHLANERTYHAGVRTGANVMALGLAVAKFADVGAYSLGAGVVLVAVGAFGILYATHRYYHVNRDIEHGRVMTGRRGLGPILATAVLLMAILLAFALLIAGGVVRAS